MLDAKIMIKRSNNESLIKSLHSQCLPTDEYYESDSPVYSWVIYKGKEAIGFAMLTLLSNRIAYLSRSGIVSEYQGKGLQKRLIRVRERFARENGYETMITYTHIHNMPSSVNLMKCGYRFYEPEWDYAGEGFLYFKKTL